MMTVPSPRATIARYTAGLHFICDSNRWPVHFLIVGQFPLNAYKFYNLLVELLEYGFHVFTKTRFYSICSFLCPYQVCSARVQRRLHHAPFATIFVPSASIYQIPHPQPSTHALVRFYILTGWTDSIVTERSTLSVLIDLHQCLQ